MQSFPFVGSAPNGEGDELAIEPVEAMDIRVVVA
jgi:hypothetical protein